MRLQTALILLTAVVIASGCGGTDSPDMTETDNTPSGPSEPADETAEAPESVTVEYTSSGFQPSTVRVQQGGTVTWVNNNSGQGMWVGSDRHPSHTQYDGTSESQHCSGGSSDTFDQCSTGDRYSFTFEKTGEWSYHNHRLQAHGGTVVVE